MFNVCFAIASNTAYGNSVAEAVAACDCLSSRPGVLYFNFTIKNRNTVVNNCVYKTYRDD